MADDVFFWSGSDRWALALRAIAPHLALKINVKTVADVVRAQKVYHANIVEVSLEQMTPALQSACQERGIKVMIYEQQKNLAAFRAILDWGAEMINLNHADAFLDVLRTYQKQ
jgi:hypothetical protein